MSSERAKRILFVFIIFRGSDDSTDFAMPGVKHGFTLTSVDDSWNVRLGLANPKVSPHVIPSAVR
jgi:hypothetical protein